MEEKMREGTEEKVRGQKSLLFLLFPLVFLLRVFFFLNFFPVALPSKFPCYESRKVCENVKWFYVTNDMAQKRIFVNAAIYFGIS